MRTEIKAPPFAKAFQGMESSLIGSAKAGLKFERKVGRQFQGELPPRFTLHQGPWLHSKTNDEDLGSYCKPDFVLEPLGGQGRVVVVEVKLTQNPQAFQKYRKVYEGAAGRCWGRPVRFLLVVKTLSREGDSVLPYTPSLGLFLEGDQTSALLHLWDI